MRIKLVDSLLLQRIRQTGMQRFGNWEELGETSGNLTARFDAICYCRVGTPEAEKSIDRHFFLLDLHCDINGIICWIGIQLTGVYFDLAID